jgi:outer membrane protein assembly factor BamB
MRGGAYLQTPLVYGDYLYSCRVNGVLSCYRARTGERLYQERLGKGGTGFTASPVAGDGKLYFTSEEGDVYVVKAGPEFELLAKNALGEVTMATPAISEGTLYFRTRHHLLAVRDDEARASSCRSLWPALASLVPPAGR